MSAQSKEEQEMAQLLVKTLNLEGVTAADIAPEAPLFGQDAPDSLGLDSIDALQIVMEIQNTYQIAMRAGEETTQAFTSLRSLTQYVQLRRKTA